MSVDREELANQAERARTERAFEVEEPLQSPTIGPRLIPLVITVIIALVIIVLLFRAWG
jgi:hypothetical protein